MTALGPAAASQLVGFFRAARRNRELAVLEGFHAVKHAVRFGADVVRVVALEGAEPARLASGLAPDVVAAFADVEAVGEEVFRQLAPRAPRTGVIGVARRPGVDLETVMRGGGAPCVLLEDPQDLSNVGACVRVAAAAGARGVVTTGAKDPWAPGALRGSAGLHYALPVARAAEIPDGAPLVALDPGGAEIGAIPEGAVLAFGTERAGLSAGLLARADAVVSLPMRAGVSSLNLATAVSAVLYAWRLGRRR